MSSNISSNSYGVSSQTTVTTQTLSQLTPEEQAILDTITSMGYNEADALQQIQYMSSSDAPQLPSYSNAGAYTITQRIAIETSYRLYFSDKLNTILANHSPPLTPSQIQLIISQCSVVLNNDDALGAANITLSNIEKRDILHAAWQASAWVQSTYNLPDSWTPQSTSEADWTSGTPQPFSDDFKKEIVDDYNDLLQTNIADQTKNLNLSDADLATLKALIANPDSYQPKATDAIRTLAMIIGLKTAESIRSAYNLPDSWTPTSPEPQDWTPLQALSGSQLSAIQARLAIVSKLDTLNTAASTIQSVIDNLPADDPDRASLLDYLTKIKQAIELLQKMLNTITEVNKKKLLNSISENGIMSENLTKLLAIEKAFREVMTSLNDGSFSNFGLDSGWGYVYATPESSNEAILNAVAASLGTDYASLLEDPATHDLLLQAMNTASSTMNVNSGFMLSSDYQSYLTTLICIAFAVIVGALGLGGLNNTDSTNADVSAQAEKPKVNLNMDNLLKMLSVFGGLEDSLKNGSITNMNKDQIQTLFLSAIIMVLLCGSSSTSDDDTSPSTETIKAWTSAISEMEPSSFQALGFNYQATIQKISTALETGDTKTLLTLLIAVNVQIAKSNLDSGDSDTLINAIKTILQMIKALMQMLENKPGVSPTLIGALVNIKQQLENPTPQINLNVQG